MSRLSPSTVESAPPDSLPEVLPIFPLTGALLLPGGQLPLHIFEPRYRKLVQDALATDAVLGMIQPFVPQQDNQPATGSEQVRPPLYDTGCVGWIQNHETTPDGRYLLTLLGLRRFKVIEELPTSEGGYRRVRANYEDAAAARGESGWLLDRKRLIAALSCWLAKQGQELVPERLADLKDLELLHAVAGVMPFHPAEKQALLEATTAAEREQVLAQILELGGYLTGEATPPTALN